MASQAQSRRPAGTTLDEEDVTRLALHCDSPHAAQHGIGLLEPVQGSLDDAGDVTALWTTAWARRGDLGARIAVRAGHLAAPSEPCSLEPAVMILDDAGDRSGIAIPEVSIHGQAVRLVCRGDAEQMIAVGGATFGAPRVSVGLAAWPVPAVILKRLAAPRAVADVADGAEAADVGRGGVSVPNYEALAAAGRQLNGKPLPAGAWCDVCGTALSSSDHNAEGVCARCHTLDVFREDATALRVWSVALAGVDRRSNDRSRDLVSA